MKELDLIKKILSVKGDIDKYVILCEDEQGRYIKYAFIDGEPHDNRCLSWYDKLQPNALKRNVYCEIIGCGIIQILIYSVVVSSGI